MGKTKIEWARNASGSAGSTWNPIRARAIATGKVGTYCQRISEGCKHCYASAHNLRNLPHGSTGLDYDAQGGRASESFINPKMLAEPLCRKKPETYFVCSMTDLFLERHTNEMISALFGVMAATPQHTYQVLTKRPGRARKFFEWVGDKAPVEALGRIAAFVSGIDLCDRSDGRAWPLNNIWLGVSVEDQANADKRIPELLATDAVVRFLSCEPLLGAIDLNGYLCDHEWERGVPCGINWTIVGGESGHGARPMHPAWARSLRDQCVAAGVPFFMKQMTNAAGRKIPMERWPTDLQVREMPNAV
jgi:protein gp37